MKRKLILSIILVAIIGLSYVWLRPDHTATPHQVAQTTEPKSETPSPKPTKPNFNKEQYSLTDPTSIWVIVNKTHHMQPVSFVPSDLRLPNVSQRIPGAQEMKLRAPAASALEQMFLAASKADFQLRISTAYRGYTYQKELYDGYVQSDGQAAADTYSARPGYSEHQTGLAVDIRTQSNQCSLNQCFGSLAEGKWLAANAYKYGFLLRYPKDKQSITGYKYEPWHFRYVGTGLSKELHKLHTETLEEFFGVSGGAHYN
jgi:D-alanyl-D-alanine carboxypeptidase